MEVCFGTILFKGTIIPNKCYSHILEPVEALHWCNNYDRLFHCRLISKGESPFEDAPIQTITFLGNLRNYLWYRFVHDLPPIFYSFQSYKYRQRQIISRLKRENPHRVFFSRKFIRSHFTNFHPFALCSICEHCFIWHFRSLEFSIIAWTLLGKIDKWGTSFRDDSKLRRFNDVFTCPCFELFLDATSWFGQINRTAFSDSSAPSFNLIVPFRSSLFHHVFPTLIIQPFAHLQFSR